MTYPPQSPQTQLKQGDTFLWPIAFTAGTKPDTPINITGYAITLTLKDANGVVLATLTVGSGITITNAAAGLAQAIFASTAAWTGNVEAQIATVDTNSTKITYDAVVIGMVAVI